MQQLITRASALLVLASAPWTLAAQSASQAGSTSAPEKKAVVRFLPSASDTAKERRTFEGLYRLLEPKKVTAKTDESVEDIIRAECGTVRLIQLELFRRANPGLTSNRVAKDSTVAVPPCPVWHENAEITVPAGSELRAAVKQHAGVVGPKTLSSVVDRNREVIGDVAQGYVASEPLHLVLPYDTHASAWKVRDTWSGSDAEVRSLLAALPNALAVDIDGGEVQLEAEADTTTCKAPLDMASWPFSRADVLHVLRDNARLFPNVAHRPQMPIIVGIVDTGIEPGETRLPLHESSSEKNGGDDDDNDGNGYTHDVYGANIPAAGGFPGVDTRLPRGGHGTAVAGLAAGGVPNDSLAEEVRRRFALKILSVVARTEVAGSPPQFDIPKDAVLSTLGYQTERIPLSVINYSIESRRKFEGFKTWADYSSALVVIAAGNDHLDVDGNEVYPAQYRLGNNRNIITVAAHNPLTPGERGMLRTRQPDAATVDVMPSFSNSGRSSVDLAAPGCRVPIYTPGGKLSVGSGTSYAAPIVSFAAALIMSEGVATPALARRRILASVDIVPGLNAFTSGILNIPKALTLFEDLVEMKTGEVYRGKITGLTGFRVDNTPYPIKRVLKIVPLADGKVRLFLVGNPDGIRIAETSTSVTQITFTETNGATRQISLNQISDIVMAEPEYRKW